MLTRSGVATCATAAASFAAGRVFGLPELFVVGAALVAAVVLAIAAVTRRRPVLTVTRTAHPPMVHVGEIARVDLALHNPTGRRSPSLTAWEAVGAGSVAQFRLAPIAPGATTASSYRVPTSARGHVTIGPLRIDRVDVLGLCAVRTWLTGSGEVVVVPHVVPLRFPDARSRGPLGEAVRTRAWSRSGTEFHAQREYVPGDDLRRVNWKATARVGDLIVTERAPESVRHCTVVFDPRLPDGSDGSTFEQLASAAASVVTAAASAEVATRFVAPGIDLRGPTVAPDTMRFLAGATERDEAPDPLAAGRGTADGIGLVVLVSAVGSANGWSGPDDITLALMVGEHALSTVGTSTSRGITVDGTSASTLSASWDRVVHGEVRA